MGTENVTVVINMFRMRAGESVDSFAEFSAEADQPVCLAHSAVVKGFKAYRLSGASATEFAADIIEVMEVSDLAEWENIRDNDPSFRPLVQRFEELVDPDSVRSTVCIPIRPRT
jgi:hypothetical protein